jgi:hypothetical protein
MGCTFFFDCIASYLGGYLLHFITPRQMFMITAVLPFLVFCVSLLYKEEKGAVRVAVYI